MRLAFVLAALVLGCAPPETPLPLGASSDACASCHEEQADAFARSAHGSGRSPVLAALLPRVRDAWGAPAEARCVGCHEPQHVPDEDGSIACVSCHAAVGNRGSFDARLVLDLGAPLDGPFDAVIDTPAHRSERRGFVSDAQSCLTCHDVRGPQLFVEETAMEHELAIANVAAPGCASCHMPSLDDGPIATGAETDRARRSHRFVGPRGSDADGMRALMEGRVTLTLAPEAGRTAIELTNAAMGHALPTGVAMLRELRLVARIEAADGSVREEELLVLGDRMMAGDVEVALPTEADHIERRRLDPGEPRRVWVATGPDDVRVTALLTYRAYRRALTEALDLAPALSDEIVLLERAATLR